MSCIGSELKNERSLWISSEELRMMAQTASNCKMATKSRRKYSRINKEICNEQFQRNMPS
jgi:hypothetical protein